MALKIVVIEVLTAIEHQVFEQMGKTGLAGFLVFGTDVIPHINGHDGGLVVLIHQQSQAIG